MNFFLNSVNIYRVSVLDQGLFPATEDLVINKWLIKYGRVLIFKGEGWRVTQFKVNADAI